MLATLPRKLIRVGAWAVAIVVIGNPLADSLGLKYWQPIAYDSILPVYAYQQRERPVDVLFLGTSRTACLSPPDVERVLRNETGQRVTVYSLAQLAVNTAASWWLLRDTFETNGTPMVVVLELPPSSVNANRTFHGELEWYGSSRDLVRMLPSLTDRTRVLSAVKGLLRGWSSLVSSVLVPPGSRSSRRRLAAIDHDGGLQMGSESSLAERPHDERARMLGREIEESRRELWRSYAIGGPALKALESIVDACRLRGCRVVLYDPPDHPDYLAAVPPSMVAEFTRFIAAFSAQHGLRFVDFNTQEARARLRLTDADFMDYTHLSTAGAERFTPELVRSVLLGEQRCEVAATDVQAATRPRLRGSLGVSGGR